MTENDRSHDADDTGTVRAICTHLIRLGKATDGISRLSTVLALSAGCKR